MAAFQGSGFGVSFRCDFGKLEKKNQGEKRGNERILSNFKAYKENSIRILIYLIILS